MISRFAPPPVKDVDNRASIGEKRTSVNLTTARSDISRRCISLRWQCEVEYQDSQGQTIRELVDIVNKDEADENAIVDFLDRTYPNLQKWTIIRKEKNWKYRYEVKYKKSEETRNQVLSYVQVDVVYVNNKPLIKEKFQDALPNLIKGEAFVELLDTIHPNIQKLTIASNAKSQMWQIEVEDKDEQGRICEHVHLLKQAGVMSEACAHDSSRGCWAKMFADEDVESLIVLDFETSKYRQLTKEQEEDLRKSEETPNYLLVGRTLRSARNK